MEPEELVKDRRTQAAALVIIAAGLIALSPTIADKTLLQHEQLQFNASVNVSTSHNNTSKVGIAAGSQGLDYGDIGTGVNSTRFIQMRAENRTYLDFQASGNITPYLSYPDQMYIEGTRNISIELEPGEEGYYTGKITINAEWANGGLGERWMELKR